MNYIVIDKDNNPIAYVPEIEEVEFDGLGLQFLNADGETVYFIRDGFYASFRATEGDEEGDEEYEEEEEDEEEEDEEDISSAKLSFEQLTAELSNGATTGIAPTPGWGMWDSQLPPPQPPAASAEPSPRESPV